jgi:hypothetical protein
MVMLHTLFSMPGFETEVHVINDADYASTRELVNSLSSSMTLITIMFVVIVVQVGALAFAFWRLRLTMYTLISSRSASASVPLLGSKLSTSFDDVEILSAI